MKCRSIGAFAISVAFPVVLLGAGTNAAHAQDEDKKTESVPEPPQAATAKPADAVEDAHDDAAPPATTGEDDHSPASRPALYGKRSDWFIEPYGYVRFDAIEDSTQSFEDGIQPNLIARAGTYKGDHRRTIFTARDSRLGMSIGAPMVGSIKTHGQIEFDFYGIVPTDARRHDSVVFGPLRIRHAFVKLETPLGDVVAGQYYDLFGWNGHFYPGTVGYQGVPAQVYHRNPQLRLEEKLQLGGLELLLAAAAVRPAQRDSGMPEGQAGLKLAFKGWSGAAMSGFGPPTHSALSIGVSGLYRRFELPAFRSEPGSEAVKATGRGIAVSALVPVIPVASLDDRSNALTLTGEFSSGAGIADMYTFMDGGSRFPLLPNPIMAAPAVQYPTNIDPGLVTFDRNLEIKTIDWQAFVVGLQYYLPINRGRVWISGVFSRVESKNIKSLTPQASFGGVFTKMEYADGNLGFEITPSVLVGLSFQTVKQVFADLSPPTPRFGAIVDETLGGGSIDGTGGVPASARNNRAQLSLSMFF